VRIVAVSDAHRDAWLALRIALWPDEEAAVMAEDVDRMLAAAHGDRPVWVAVDESGVVGFAEASLRRDYVNGCETCPVAFLEGIYVAPHARRQGIGRALDRTVQDWAIMRGCHEYASDALLENRESHAFYAALGFEETERVVYFRRQLSA
jgi:aminoglycoside 6'-N-acetyltransferase I